MFNTKKNINYPISLWVILMCFSSFSWSSESFADWKYSFYKKAVKQGVSEYNLSNFLQVKEYHTAISNYKGQSEFKKFLWDYINSILSTTRLTLGKSYFIYNRKLLDDIYDLTGVPQQIIMAIWGIESWYGKSNGKIPIMSAMATLAYNGHRRPFYERELISLLKLIDRGDIKSFSVKGSWAGGLGMAQFIPTSYIYYGVDYNNDGFVNLWEVEDALASIGNFLYKLKWQSGIRWGQEVELKTGFDYLLSNEKIHKTVGEWKKLGVMSINDNKLHKDDNVDARLFVPAGKFGPKFLLYKNFNVIKRYNNSDAYALAVGLLSDEILTGNVLHNPWPKNAKKITGEDIKNIQTTLSTLGFYNGKIDGIFGNGTRRSLQKYQRYNGIVADGFLSISLYDKLMKE